MRVLLALDVPAGSPDLSFRTAQLADDYSALIARTLPGVRAWPAVIDGAVTAAAPAAAAGTEHGVTVDVHSREVRVDGRTVHVTYREFELLTYLMQRPRCIVSRGELVREVWRGAPGAATLDGSYRTVDTHVRRLRTKLGPYAHILTTVRGRGYRCEPGSAGCFRSA